MSKFSWTKEVTRRPTADDIRYGGANRGDEQITVNALNPLGIALSAVAGLILTILVILAIGAVFKSYNRYQRTADANNRVKVTRIEIKNARQQAFVVRANNNKVFQQGQQRIIAAKALAESQRLIHATLTPLYVQLEAIKAQEQIATSGKNNTVIYVPAGTNGTPTIAQDAKGASLTAEPQAGN